MTISNRIVWTCQFQDRFVTKSIFDLMKSFTSLPPAHFYIEDQAITYTIPYHQIVDGSPMTRYTITTDFDFATSECLSYTPQTTPRFFSLQSNTYPSATVNGIVLHEETVSTLPFRLRESSQYADVEVTTQRRVVLNEYKQMIFKWQFEEIMTMPFESVANRSEYLYFTDPPRYQVTLFPPYCSLAIIQDFLTVALPNSLQIYDFSITR